MGPVACDLWRLWLVACRLAKAMHLKRPGACSALQTCSDGLWMQICSANATLRHVFSAGLGTCNTAHSATATKALVAPPGDTHN